MNQQPPVRSPAPPVSQWVKGTKIRCIKAVPFGPGSTNLFAVGDETEVFELGGVPFSEILIEQCISIAMTRICKGALQMGISEADSHFEFVSFPEGNSVEQPVKFKSIPEIIAEWRKGCGNTQVGHEHPGTCAECTDAMIDAVLKRHEQDLKAAEPVATAEEILHNESVDQEAWKPFLPVVTCAPGYERLAAVLKAAHDQAAYGKGADRHANNLPFHEQRMQQISQLFDSPLGMAYQVAKKVAEGLDLPTHDRQVAELLGAINYIAGIVIFLEDRQASEAEQ